MTLFPKCMGTREMPPPERWCLAQAGTQDKAESNFICWPLSCAWPQVPDAPSGSDHLSDKPCLAPPFLSTVGPSEIGGARHATELSGGAGEDQPPRGALTQCGGPSASPVPGEPEQRPCALGTQPHSPSAAGLAPSGVLTQRAGAGS